ncbi:MAG: DUF1566 domain-containing protein [Nitrospinae bacterium]|nr:DUF1566 domain-containing protein [Nitrospinota bacterium]
MERKDTGKTGPRAADSPQPSGSPRFVDNGDGTVTDLLTGLMWMKNDTWLELGRLVTWHQGQEYAAKMSERKFAGHRNWRLPTGTEARELFDPEFSNTDREGVEIHLDPVFPSGCGHTTWTSETRGAKAAMGYDYRADYEYWLAKENDGFPSGARLVRHLQTAQDLEREENRFVDNGDGTVSDLETGLMWKKSDSYLDLDKWVTWAEAKTYCLELNKQYFAKREDWRLPTRKEAMTIYDPNHPTTDAYGDTVYLYKVFPPGAGITTWTKTLSKSDKTLAMRFHYYNGDYKWHKQGLRSHGVRAVRTFKPKEGQTDETED